MRFQEPPRTPRALQHILFHMFEELQRPPGFDGCRRNQMLERPEALRTDDGYLTRWEVWPMGLEGSLVFEWF